MARMIKKNLKKIIMVINEKKVKRKNKKLMIEKILSYSSNLLEGIEKYKDANLNFMFLIFIGILLANFPLISVPCCLLAICYFIKMFQFIKYSNIITIVNILGGDLAFKGIYDKEKIEELIEDFSEKYGKDIIEYKELIRMVDRYESLVTKIECAINNMTIKNQYDSIEESAITLEGNFSYENDNNNEYLKKRVKDYYKDFNDKLSLTYKDEDGEIKKISRAIEFFNDEEKNGQEANTVILKSNKRGNDSKLTVYLYKKSSKLQNNAL